MKKTAFIPAFAVGENRGRFSVMTEKQRMTYNEPGDEYGENSKSSGRQRDLPCDAAGITDKGYSKTTRNAYREPSPVHLVEENTALRKWYERNGAVHTGTEKYDFFPFTCGYMMIRL